MKQYIWPVSELINLKKYKGARYFDVAKHLLQYLVNLRIEHLDRGHLHRRAPLRGRPSSSFSKSRRSNSKSFCALPTRAPHSESSPFHISLDISLDISIYISLNIFLDISQDISPDNFAPFHFPF